MTNELKIAETLKELGVPADLLGYFYLKFAISLMLQDISLMNCVTKRLYPMIANEFNTSWSRVERVIRHAIEVSWNRGNVELQNKLFGYTIDMSKCKPTNSEFICTVVDWLNMTCKRSESNAE